MYVAEQQKSFDLFIIGHIYLWILYFFLKPNLFTILHISAMGLLDLLALSFGYTKNNLNVPVNVRTDANANLNANAYIQPGAFTGQANVDAIGMQTGAVQANANVQPGAFAGQANVDALGMQTGAVQANANIQPGAFAGQANVDALGMQTGAVQMNASIQPRAFAGQANVVGMQTGAFQTTGVAPNGIQVCAFIVWQFDEY